MHIVIFFALTLLDTIAPTVECCVLNRAKGLRVEKLEHVAVVGTVGDTDKLPGYLESPTQPLFKDNQGLYAGEFIHAS